MEIIGEESISIYDLKRELSRIKKRDEELGYRAGKVVEYVNNFAVLKLSEADALKKELMELGIPRFKEVHANKILDLLPGSVEELKNILGNFTITISDENLKKIFEVVKKYLPKDQKI